MPTNIAMTGEVSVPECHKFWNYGLSFSSVLDLAERPLFSQANSQHTSAFHFSLPKSFVVSPLLGDSPDTHCHGYCSIFE
jgi:hypothetical protein